MIYEAYQAHDDLSSPVRAMAELAANSLGGQRKSDNIHLRRLAASYELVARCRLIHERPAYGISTVRVGNREVEVCEEAAWATAFGTLLHFKKDIATEQPRVLLVAPMSGHFATLLRGTVRTMLPEHDVYITDWHNARNVSLWQGRFDFASFIDHIMRFIEAIGAGAHVVAVCQPCPAVLATVALMAEDGHPNQPRSLTLMAGPIDCRVNPTRVNELATSRSIDWFERNLVASVPWRYPGAMRLVYPGFLQLAAFMSMNIDRHVKAHLELFDHVVNGDQEKAQAIRTFYDEYLAVMDLPAEFYLETVRLVFQEHALAQGKLEFHGRRVNPSAIRRTALFTVEGEKDDICSVGQTVAAHDLCDRLRPYLKRHHMQAGAGHYGVFNGGRWNSQIYPLVKNVILAFD